MTGKRLVALLVGLSAIGIPAAALSIACAGNACASAEEETIRIPFCPLPGPLRGTIERGYREGRSPDVLGVANGTPVYTEVSGLRAPWPAVDTFTDTRVPIVFWGAGVTQGATLPDGVALDAIAPTVSDILGFEREHPEVRSGTPDRRRIGRGNRTPTGPARRVEGRRFGGAGGTPTSVAVPLVAAG